MAQAIQVAKLNGARDVYVAFVHPILTKNAIEKLSAEPVKEFITTNTVPIPKDRQALFGSRLTVLSIGPLLAEVIRRANEGKSVGAMFNE
jgi:ribose-phosphate pyrophosphokinase